MNEIWVLVIDGAPIHYACGNELQSLKDCLPSKSQVLGDDIRGCRWSMKGDGILHLEGKCRHEYQLHRVEKVRDGMVERRDTYRAANRQPDDYIGSRT